MAKSRKAYVDTSAFIAFADRSDSHHQVFRRLFSAPQLLVTTPLVVAEGHAWFLRRYDRIRALQFLAMLEDMPMLTLHPVGQKENAAGVGLLRRFSDQELTMADAVGLHVMDAERIRSCWSTDRHLALTGVTLVIHQ